MAELSWRRLILTRTSVASLQKSLTSFARDARVDHSVAEIPRFIYRQPQARQQL
jgi:hypothetical protein